MEKSPSRTKREGDRRSPTKVEFVRLLVFGLVAGGAAVAGYRIGDGNIDRLPNHNGYYLTSVTESAFAPPPRRPRHTVVVVVDGLRQDFARRLASLDRLKPHGQCRAMDNGQLTISRPMYTVLSSGLEADRTGSRNNDLTTPVDVGSIWENARESGLLVAGYSELTWWQQLFPEGFTTYIADERVETNLFELAVLTDLTLIHPVYVDHAGHEQGAGSTVYRDAVSRLDRELDSLIDKLDLDRDLLVLAADHGHTEVGGHGGPEETVAHVLLCYAGAGVKVVTGEPPLFDARSFAPTLAVLTGVRFPSHMRAGDDRLDQIWTVADDSLGSAYLEARIAGVERFRAENRKLVSQWLGADGDWDELYTRERYSQKMRALAAVLMIALGFVVFARLSKICWQRALEIALWMVATVTVAGAIYSLWRGGFGFTSINSRAEFLRAGISSSLIASAAATALHLAYWRRPVETVRDLCVLTVVVLAMALAHLRVYGDPFGFPLPSDVELFFPFFAAAMIISSALITLVAAVVIASASAIRAIIRA